MSKPTIYEILTVLASTGQYTDAGQVFTDGYAVDRAYKDIENLVVEEYKKGFIQGGLSMFNETNKIKEIKNETK